MPTPFPRARAFAFLESRRSSCAGSIGRLSGYQMGVQVHRTRIERIEADLLVFYPLAGSALAYGVRRALIPLANSENGTVQGAVATW